MTNTNTAQETSEDDEYLRFSVKVLNHVNMWPRQRKYFISGFMKDYYIFALILLATVTSLLDFILQFFENELSMISINDNITASSALFGIIYTYICFKQKKDEVKVLVDDLKHFEQFCPREKILETDKSVTFYSKCFLIYGIFGNFCYNFMPFLSYKHCLENRSSYMIKYGIPCGLTTSVVFPFKIDYFPLAPLVMMMEMVVCTIGSIIVLMVTMLLSGFLMHITSQLKYLKELILESSNIGGEDLKTHVKFCIKYHIAVIEYSDRTNKAFSLMMLLHITWTGLVIGVLGFQIILVDRVTDRSRYLMHLAGWLLLLFIVCYYGQTLLDESAAVCEAAYNVEWYDMACSIQKDFGLVIMRSQSPLTLKAFGMKEMSLATYLGVLYSAYSYFTLLLKFQGGKE